MSTASDAAVRVAEYVRQRTIQEFGDNVDSTIHGVHTDVNAERALLDTNDLRLLLAADTAVRELHRAADPDGYGLICVHCTALADCDVRWPCRTVRALSGEAQAS